MRPPCQQPFRADTSSFPRGVVEVSAAPAVACVKTKLIDSAQLFLPTLRILLRTLRVLVVIKVSTSFWLYLWFRTAFFSGKPLLAAAPRIPRLHLVALAAARDT